MVDRLLFLPEPSRGEFEKGFVVRLKGRGGEGFEASRKIRRFAPQQQPGACCAEDEADDESDDHAGAEP